MPKQVGAEKKGISRRIINTAFKILVVLLPAGLLYYELTSKDNLDSIIATFYSQLENANGCWLAGALLLIPFNWLTEVQKWQPLVARYEDISQGQALKAVLAGFSFALFTPNRVGEYGGRILFVRPENRWKAVLANAVGNMSQYLVLVSGGVLGSAWFVSNMMGWANRWVLVGLLLTACAVAAILYLYFNIRLLIRLIPHIPFLRRWQSLIREIRFLEKLERSELSMVLGWSVVRYGVYSTQYLFLLHFFEINAGWVAGYAGIATIYLLQTIVPLPAIAGLLVRGSLAVFVWSYFGANEISSLAASFVLWIINLILPALIGTFSLFSVNITKSLGYDDD